MYKCSESTGALEGGMYCSIIQGIGVKKKCAIYRGISLFSISEKLYGRVIIEGLMASTEYQTGDVHGGFRRGKGCYDQVFFNENIATDGTIFIFLW